LLKKKKKQGAAADSRRRVEVNAQRFGHGVSARRDRHGKNH